MEVEWTEEDVKKLPHDELARLYIRLREEHKRQVKAHEEKRQRGRATKEAAERDAAELRILWKAAQAHAAGQERALVEQKARMAEVLTARSRQADALRARNEELGRQVAALELALRASRELREEAMKVFVVLVAAEDNEALSEDEYNRRMDAAVKRARTLLSREKLQGATEIQLRAS